MKVKNSIVSEKQAEINLMKAKEEILRKAEEKIMKQQCNIHSFKTDGLKTAGSGQWYGRQNSIFLQEYESFFVELRNVNSLIEEARLEIDREMSRLSILRENNERMNYE